MAQAGAAWVESAPDRIAGYARAWGFELGEPFPDLTYAFVAPVTLAGGSDAVLKAQPPHMESRSELAALAAWDGDAAVRLLRADPDAGIALLERLRPGARLAEVADDDKSTRIAARLMPRLWREPPADPALITAERWGQGFECTTWRRYPDGGPIPFDMFGQAATIGGISSATTPKPPAPPRRPSPRQHPVRRPRTMAGHRPQGHRR
ncbi:MAG: aminoglycoside phosphotransferase family protein [Dehalococcoidia bacterium]|nr:aminoglycoside phosphotransferase family protein [Dehalococcoidia bacterium]